MSNITDDVAEFLQEGAKNAISVDELNSLEEVSRDLDESLYGPLSAVAIQSPPQTSEETKKSSS